MTPDDPAEGGGAETSPPDLRFSQSEDRGVRVDRNLSGQGHLARGSATNMSSLRFSVRAQPRTERDPELEALRPVTPDRAAPVDVPAPPTPPTPAPAPAPALPTTSAADGGFVAALKRLFS